jgi:type IV pilus assembly protein PilA
MKTRNVVLLVLLGVALILFTTGVVVVALVVPKLGHSRMAALEMAAVHEIRNIDSAQVQYFSMYGKYAATLADLGPPAAEEKNGYVFTLSTTPGGFAIHANPKVYNSTGRRTFYSDQTLEIHQNFTNEPATANSPELR